MHRNRFSPLRAVIFDFNGVIADDETPHLLCFQQALKEHGLSLTKEDYYRTYLGMDERLCAEALLIRREGRCDPTRHDQIIARKAQLFRDHTGRQRPPLFPAAVEFVKAARAHHRLAIASGGRREQIEYALRGTAIENDFAVIVSADDCAIGKPDPAVYLLTLKLLNGREPRPPLIKAEECLVIEDARAGIKAARAAGMKVVALATTYAADDLTEADVVLPGLEAITPVELEQRLSRAADTPEKEA